MASLLNLSLTDVTKSLLELKNVQDALSLERQTRWT